MKPRWLDRRISAPGPHLTLCLNEREFRQAVRHLGIKDSGSWMKNTHSDATTHLYERKSGLVAIVALCSRRKKRSPIEIAGLLVHEAVHVWQAWCDRIGETHPAFEQEAYGVQSIAQELMAEYARRVK